MGNQALIWKLAPDFTGQGLEFWTAAGASSHHWVTTETRKTPEPAPVPATAARDLQPQPRHLDEVDMSYGVRT